MVENHNFDGSEYIINDNKKPAMRNTIYPTNDKPKSAMYKSVILIIINNQIHKMNKSLVCIKMKKQNRL